MCKACDAARERAFPELSGKNAVAFVAPETPSSAEDTTTVDVSLAPADEEPTKKPARTRRSKKTEEVTEDDA
jgi:hypothetical protein